MPWFVRPKEDEFCIIKGTKGEPGEEVACHDTEKEAIAQMRALYASETKAATRENGNALKAISETDEELRVANYIVLFGGRDLTGAPSDAFYTGELNKDGSRGEFFTKATVFDSPYTDTGHLLVDWEHGQGKVLDGSVSPDRDEIFGVVDWKSLQVDELGLWVERVLSRRSQYMKWVETLIKAGVVGTSTEAVRSQVEKKATGEITRWPLKRDTLTVSPFEWRMANENVLQAAKALGIQIDDNEPNEPEPEAQPEAGTTEQCIAVEAAKAKAVQRQLELELSLMEVT